MKLKDFIKVLKDIENQDLIVMLADWNEDYAPPWELKVDKIVVVDDSLILGMDEQDQGRWL